MLVRKPSRAQGATATVERTHSVDRTGIAKGFEQSRLPEQPDEEPLGGLQSIGFYAVLLFIYFRFSFLHEFVGAKLHANLHVIILLGGASYLCWLLSGNGLRGFKERSTWLWLAFVCWMAIATVTSFWKGGSFQIFYEYLETAVPVVLVIPALVTTKGQISKVIDVMGLACITTTVLGTINDDFTSGRMGVDVASSEIQNPNDFAAHLILMLPVLAFWGFRSGRTVFHKAIAGGCMALCLRQVLSSGSRGALVSLAITAIYLVIWGSKRVKTAILVGVPLLALLAVPFVPKESLSRLSTLFSSAAAAKNGEATESSEARMQLLQDSVKFTFQHPLSGVGPGEFMDYQAQDAAASGQRGMWHVTHNSYTQVSCECGIPAFLCYTGAIALTLGYLRKVRKAGDPELAPIAATLTVMYVGFLVCIFFLSMAYTVHILILSALAVSLKLRAIGPSGSEEPARLPASPEAVPA